MKLQDPTIYVLHKVEDKWARTAFSFTGSVDRKRVKREIIKAFRRGGAVVHPTYIEASIDQSLKAASNKQKALLGTKVLSAALDTEQQMDIHQAEYSNANETAH